MTVPGSGSSHDEGGRHEEVPTPQPSASITVGPGMKAFAMGVVAGDKALALARDFFKDKPFEEGLGYFWLCVGRASASQDLGGEEAQAAFIAGAATRAPSRTGFSCYFETDGAQFHSQDPDADDFDLNRDTDDRIAGIRRALTQVAIDVASGAEDALIFDANGNRIGAFSINEA